MNYQPAMSHPALAVTPPTPPADEPAACLADINQNLLTDCLRQAREWEMQLPADGPERHTANQLKILVEELLRDGNPSIIAMCKVRTLLCSNCRQLHVTHEQCEGEVLQPLDRCLLLQELVS